MNYNLEKAEQYVIVSLDETKFGENIAAQFEKMIIILYREGFMNMIYDFSKISSIDDEGLSLLRKAAKVCSKEGGVVIVVTKNDDLIDAIDGAMIENLIILPTTDEAIDGVFMNELENEFEDEEDEDYEFDSEGSFDKE
jgi:anti-sigma B factor antagonist